jgi:hypothetical protein
MRHHIRKVSGAQEKRAARDIGGKPQAASGACRHGGGGDARAIGKTRVECKFTEKNHYDLRLDVLLKIEEQARKALETPVLQLGFRNIYSQMDLYAILRWDDYLAGLQSCPGCAKSARECFIIPGQYKLTHEEMLQLLVHKAVLKLVYNHDPNNKSYAVIPWTEYLELAQ